MMIKPFPKQLALAVCVATAIPAHAATDIDALQKQIKALQAAIQEIKSEQKSAVKSTQGGIIIGDTKVSVGGYIKGDLVHTTDGVNGSLNALITPADTKKSDPNADNRTDLSARESRFWIKSSTEVAGKPFKTHLEADFYGSGGNEYVSNSYGLRLRHAYGVWGNVLVGQTWSTFMDVAALGEINAFGQHASPIFVRQGQVRYTHPYEGGNLMFALENGEDGGDDDSAPDIVARANFDGDWGHASIGVLSRKMGGDSDRDWENAVSLSAKLPTVGKDDIRLQYNYGALGRYMGLGQYLEGAVDGARDVWGASIAYRHFWSDSLRSTFLYSKTEADDKDIANLLDEAESIHINLMWSPSPKLRYGIEYASWELNSDGTESDFDALHLSARYIF
ncbi:MAG: DcaP family trimeric outer membrane transporter [Neptuniibacter sp.]